MSLPETILLKADFKLTECYDIDDFRNGICSFSGIYKNVGYCDEPEKAIYVKQGTKSDTKIRWKDDIKEWQASSYQEQFEENVILESDGSSPNKLPKFFVSQESADDGLRRLYRVVVDYDTFDVSQQLHSTV